MHVGHRSTSHGWDQQLVFDALARDIADHQEHGIPTPGAILVTGDIAFGAAADQYQRAGVWLDRIASTLGIASDRIFLVPGNHDVDRGDDVSNRSLARLLRGLREGVEILDDVLGDPGDHAILTSRLASYLAFAAEYPSMKHPDPLFWSHTLTSAGLPIRLIGLPTALLAAGDVDHGKLRLGKAPLAATLTDADKSRELALVLTHHPLREGWLADQRDASQWVQSRAHVHLFGHIHEAESEDTRAGSGGGLVRVAAGAAHGDVLPPGVPASHGYNLGAVVAGPDDTLRLRIWPRRWSEPTKSFRVDVHSVPEGATHSEHELSGLRLRAHRSG